MLAIFPEIQEAVATKNIDKASALVRIYFGKSTASHPARINVVEVVQNIGLSLREAKDLSGPGAIAVRDAKGRFSGVLAYKSPLHREDHEFLLAHLLGHYFLHILPAIAAGDWSQSGFKEEILPLSRYMGRTLRAKKTDGFAPLEDEADRFAAALILPTNQLIRAWEKLKTLETTASFFNVSKVFLNQRLETLMGINHEPVAVKEASPGPQKSKGMERIRELARQLSKDK